MAMRIDEVMIDEAMMLDEAMMIDDAIMIDEGCEGVRGVCEGV